MGFNLNTTPLTSQESNLPYSNYTNYLPTLSCDSHTLSSPIKTNLPTQTLHHQNKASHPSTTRTYQSNQEGNTMQTPLILLFLISSITCLTSAATTTTASSSDFLRSSCAATAYQTTCLASLSPYARAIRSDPRRLGRVALTVSILRARDTTFFVSRVSSPTSPKSSSPSQPTLLSTAFQDCVMLIDDSASRLRQSVGELTRMGPAGSPQNAMCMSNVQTWISAALTDQNMCLSSISQAGAAGGEDAAAIMKKVEEARQVTSNALSLVNLIGAN